MDKAQKLIDTLGIKPNRQGFYSTGFGKKSLEGLKATINDMMGTKEHNGWSNYDTWAVNLWLTNDWSTDRLLTEIVLSKKENFEKADELKDFVENAGSVAKVFEDASLASDLLGSALENVDWLEIIENHFTE